MSRHTIPTTPIPHKYNAVATKVDGHIFPSKAEARRYQELKLMLAAGEIADLELQPVYILQESFKDEHGNRHRAIAYVADFRYIEAASGTVIVEDVKGMQTDVFKIKLKLLLHKHPSLDVRIV